MFMKKEDIHLMIKMENLIGLNKEVIFGEDKSKKIWVDGMEITFDDFISYINLIDRILNNKRIIRLGRVAPTPQVLKNNSTNQ